MFKEILENVRNTTPLIHNITNYVTVNDCANILLACGASPIMADDIGEAADMSAICTALNINIGTLNKNTIPSMFAAGKKANGLSHPVVLDPVGAGATPLRTSTANKLINEIQFSVIRGNISEIKALAFNTDTTKGVDADVCDKVTPENLNKTIEFIKTFAKTTNAVIAVTGAIDIVTDSEKAYCIYNGHPLMSSVTGTGCQLSAMLTAYIGANQDRILDATAAAVCAMGLCGEKAYARMSECDGNSSYRNYIIDAVYNLNGTELDKGAKYEIR